MGAATAPRRAGLPPGVGGRKGPQIPRHSASPGAAGRGAIGGGRLRVKRARALAEIQSTGSKASARSLTAVMVPSLSKTTLNLHSVFSKHTL